MNTKGAFMPNSVFSNRRKIKPKDIPRNWGPFKSYREKYPEVYDFYKDIAPDIRKRQLGVTDLPENESAAFRDILSVPMTVGETLPDTGYYSGWREYLPKWMPLRYLMPRDHVNISSGQHADEDLVHELRHALERRIGTSKGQYDLLDKIYKFRGIDIMPWLPGYSSIFRDEEMATTNKQHQFVVYKELRKLLGRAPSSKEYFDYVEKIPDDRLRALRSQVQNIYQRQADTMYNANNGKSDSERLNKVPVSFTYLGGSKIPSWTDFAPHIRQRMKSTPEGVELKMNPYYEEGKIRDQEDIDSYGKGLLEISKNRGVVSNDKSYA